MIIDRVNLKKLARKMGVSVGEILKKLGAEDINKIIDLDVAREVYKAGNALAESKWRELSFRVLEKVKTSKEAERIRFKGDCHPDIIDEAFKLQVKLTKTTKEIKKIYCNCYYCDELSDPDEIGVRIAMTRWEEISLQEVNDAKTPYELKRAIRRAHDPSEAREAGIRKMMEMEKQNK